MDGRNTQRGFSLLELMVVVCILGVLAMIVVPAWAKDSRKGRAKSEIAAMFAELRYKEESYKLDNAKYASLATCPSTPSTVPQDVTVPCAATWLPLRIQPATSKLYCTYAITAGTSAQTPSPPSPFTMPTAAVSWYYILAT